MQALAVMALGLGSMAASLAVHADVAADSVMAARSALVAAAWVATAHWGIARVEEEGGVAAAEMAPPGPLVAEAAVTS